MSSSPNKSEHSRWQSFRFGALYGFFGAIGLLPWWILYYPLAELIYVLLYYVVRYRVRVTRSNLTQAFPEKSRSDLRRLERKYYRQLAEVFVDTIDLTSISPRALRRRMGTPGRGWRPCCGRTGRLVRADPALEGLVAGVQICPAAL